MPYTPEHERKIEKVIEQMKEMGILATQKNSQFVFTNSAGEKVPPPAWLRQKQETQSATITALYSKTQNS